MNHYTSFCVSVVVALALAGAARAEFTVSTIGSYEQVADFPSYTPADVGGSPGFTLPEEMITGLDQFDPALGTLTGITLDIEADWFWQVDLEGGSVDDDELPNSIDFSISFIQIFIGYDLGGGSTAVLISADESIDAFASAEASEGPAFGSNDNFGSLMGPVDITSQVDLNDFIGLGQVTTLGAFLAYPDLVDAFDIENLDPSDTFANLSISLDPADVTLTYHYVPEPASVALLGLGAVTVVRRRRNAR